MTGPTDGPSSAFLRHRHHRGAPSESRAAWLHAGARHSAARLAAGLLSTGAVLCACTGGSSAAPPDQAGQAPPPPPRPPAACLLDVEAFAVDTGVTWRPDPTTASDTRCVYDPEGAGDADFVAVDVAPFTAPDSAAQLDALAELCASGSRTPAGELGFVCRFQGDHVFAALVRDQEVVTMATSAVPPGTTPDRLAIGFGTQLETLR